MQRTNRRKVSLGGIYSESFKSFLSAESLVIFIIGIIVFSLLYLPFQNTASVLNNLQSWNTASVSAVNSSIISSMKTLPTGISGFGSWISMISSMTSFSLAYILLFFAVVVVEVLTIKRIMSKKLELPVKSYVNLMAMSLVLGIFIIFPLLLAVFYGFSLSASLNYVVGGIIAVLSGLFLFYISVRTVFSQIYAAGLDQDPITAIESSFKITKGKFWFVLGTLVVPLIIISLVITLIFGLIAVAIPSAMALIEGIMLSLDIVILTSILTNYLVHAKELLK